MNDMISKSNSLSQLDKIKLSYIKIKLKPNKWGKLWVFVQICLGNLFNQQIGKC